MLNWREVPFFRLLLPLMVGIFLSICLGKNPVSSVAVAFAVAGLGLLLAYLHSRKISQNQAFAQRWWFGVALSLALMLSGYGLGYFCNKTHEKDFFIPKSVPESTSQIVIGVVSSEPIQREKLRLELSILQTQNESDSLVPASGKIICYVETSELSKQISYGDVLALNARIQSVEPPKNPDAFDYKTYLYFQNIHYQCFIKNNQWKKLAADRGNWIIATAYQFRQKLIKILAKHLKSDNEKSVGSALILGYKDEIPQEVLTAYINTGSMHVLSVSGLHVGVVAMMLDFFLNKITTRRRWWRVTKPTILVIFVWAFSILTGASAAVLRAAVMFTFLIVGRSLKREVNIYNILAISAFCLLCYNPFLLVDVGFQLSYMALLGIVYFQPKIYRIWLIDNKLGDHLWSLTATGIAAQLTTLPISVYFFHQFPTYFWLSGFIVVPGAVLILWTGIALFVLDFVPFLGEIVGYGLYWSIWLTNALLFLIQKLPASLVTGLFINIYAVILLFVTLIASAAAINTKRFQWILVGLASLVPVCVFMAFRTVQNQNVNKIIIYNVSKNTLIDCIADKKCDSWKGINLSEKTKNFAAQNCRWGNGISENNVIEHSFSDSLVENSKLLYSKNILVFCDKKIICHNTPIKLENNQKFPADYVLISNNSFHDAAQLQQDFEPKCIVFDASNAFYKVKKWKLECEKIGIATYDLAEKGALTIEVK